MNIQINSPWKNLQIIWQMNIFVQNILTYPNIRLYAQDCFGLFWRFLYFVLFWTHTNPLGTNNNHLKKIVTH